jgi:hypothetical protein
MREYSAKIKASKKFYCPACDMTFDGQYRLRKHNGTDKHKAKLATMDTVSNRILKCHSGRTGLVGNYAVAVGYTVAVAVVDVDVSYVPPWSSSFLLRVLCIRYREITKFGPGRGHRKYNIVLGSLLPHSRKAKLPKQNLHRQRDE